MIQFFTVKNNWKFSKEFKILDISKKLLDQ